MTTLRTIGHFAAAVALAVALAGCGDDEAAAEQSDDTSDGDAAAEQSDDTSEDDAADQGGGADADAAGGDSGDDGDSGEPGGSGADGEGADADTGSGDGGSQPAPGVYQDYSAEAVADTSYETTVLFFWASWCPECRAFEQAIQDDGVPDGVQILKTDYDTEQDLKEKYGVTIQTSFVKVDADGDELSKWVGYGEDKSVDTILEQLD